MITEPRSEHARVVVHSWWMANFYARFNVEAHIAGGGVAISTSELAHAALGLGLRKNTAKQTISVADRLLYLRTIMYQDKIFIYV